MFRHDFTIDTHLIFVNSLLTLWLVGAIIRDMKKPIRVILLAPIITVVVIIASISILADWALDD